MTTVTDVTITSTRTGPNLEDEVVSLSKKDYFNLLSRQKTKADEDVIKAVLKLIGIGASGSKTCKGCSSLQDSSDISDSNPNRTYCHFGRNGMGLGKIPKRSQECIEMERKLRAILE